MIKTKYDAIAFRFDKKGSTVIKTGNFTYSPVSDIYLSNVSVFEEDGIVTIHGYRKDHSFYDPDSSFSCINEDNISEYCIEDSDYYIQNTHWFSKLFGQKPKKVLSRGWYMKKNAVDEETYVFHGDIIEQHKTW